MSENLNYWLDIGVAVFCLLAPLVAAWIYTGRHPDRNYYRPF